MQSPAEVVERVLLLHVEFAISLPANQSAKRSALFAGVRKLYVVVVVHDDCIVDNEECHSFGAHRLNKVLVLDPMLGLKP